MKGGWTSLFGQYFTYNGHSSADFNLQIAGFSTTDTSVPLGVGREVLRGSLNRFRAIPNFMGTSYQDVLSFTVSVCKNLCVVDDEVFTEAEVNQILSWITAPNYPTLFHMYDEEPEVFKTYNYYAICNDVVPETNGEEIIGFTFSFMTNSPYVWTDTNTVNITSVSTYGTTTVTVNTAEPNMPIYPIVTITPDVSAQVGDDGRVSISIGNNRDNGVMSLRLLKIKTVIDCQRAMIYGPTGQLLTFEDLGLEDVGTIYWLKLYNGSNIIQHQGQAEIKIEYREPRKVGAY